MAEKFQIGDRISFYGGAKGRGNHVTAYAEVSKVNRKTVELVEIAPSYSPGTRWICSKVWLEEKLTPRGMTIRDFNSRFYCWSEAKTG